jgi:hypothetical protein
MFDDNISNQKIQYQYEERPWTGTETSCTVSTNEPKGPRAYIIDSIVLGIALAVFAPNVDSANWVVPPQQPSQHTYSESASINQQAGDTPRISRAEAIRLAKANRARIESQLLAEVEREAAIKAVWEEE